MVEITEERIAAEKASVDSMRRAKGNMEDALSRISRLEYALLAAITDMREHKTYIGSAMRLYTHSPKTVHDTIDENISAATKALG